MKRVFKLAIASWATLAGGALILAAIAGIVLNLAHCTNPVQPPTNPPVVVTPDTAAQTWHCVPIAPMVEDRAVGARGKFWTPGQTLRIGFPYGGYTEGQKKLVYAAFSSWAESANLKFEFPAAPPYDIRVAFYPGSAWAYIGTDCKLVGASYPTINFGFGHGTTEQAAGRSVVIEHEVGHALGLLHEQQFPGGLCWNEKNVIEDLSKPPNSWSVETIRHNVLDYHNPANVITSTYDQNSVMHYSIPGRWVCDGKTIPGGKEISPLDRAFIAKQYPGRTVPPPPPPVGTVTISKTKRDEIVRLQNLAKVYADSALTVTKKATGL